MTARPAPPTGGLPLPQTIAALAAAALAAGLFHVGVSLNHDSSWYLAATERLLDGARLYVDVVEINPPLAFYQTMPPVWLARLLGSDPGAIYVAYITLLALLASLWSFALLRGAALEARQKTALMIAVAAVLFVLPIGEFGQREHFMLIFALPFLLAQILRPALPDTGPGHGIALGLVAALGLLLKPYFLLIPAAIGIMRLVEERSLAPFRDPAMLALAAAAVGYLGFVGLVHPEYFTAIVPIARVVYGAYGTGGPQVLAKFEIIALVLLAVAGLGASHKASGTITRLFIGASVGAAAAYLVQYKGWNYHLLPLSALLILTATWLFAAAGRGSGRQPGMARIALAAGVIILGLQIARGPYQASTTSAFGPFVKQRGESILVLSADVAATFPFVNEVGGRSASRYSAQWYIPGAHLCRAADPAGDCAEEARILNIARETIIEDFLRAEPRLVFIDEKPRKLFFQGARFDYLEFLSADDRFGFFERCYRRIGAAADHGVYENTCASLAQPGRTAHSSAMTRNGAAGED